MKVKKPSADCMLVFPVLPYTVYLACSRLSVNGEDTKVKGMQKRGGGGGVEKRKKEEREPVIISCTTLFHPLLAHLRSLDFGCQTFELPMSWILKFFLT